MTKLQVATPGGCALLQEGDVKIAPGERVTIEGGVSAGKTMLFRALAGLWPWGKGRIAMPARDTMAFLPRHAYVPPGMLKAVIAYPSAPDAFDDAAYAEALESVGLARLSPELDRNARWDRELGLGEQERLSYARLLLERPSG